MPDRPENMGPEEGRPRSKRPAPGKTPRRRTAGATPAALGKTPRGSEASDFKQAKAETRPASAAARARARAQARIEAAGEGSAVARRARPRPARRTVGNRIRFTKRFYVMLGIVGVILFIIVLVAAVSSGGGGEDKTLALSAAKALGLNESQLNSLKVNELGSIMILEYHVIGQEARWARTPENFRADLDLLYEQGYRCISLRDLVTNNINVEAGYTPVVLTFDDSSQSQFNYIEQDGELVIDPECAVGVMEQFKAEHPDFNITATFFVEPRLFGQEEYTEQKLRFLVEHGYEIGNHGVTHPAFAELDDSEIMKEIAGNIKAVQNYLPGYEQISIALPYGSEPKNPEVLKSGSYDGVEYRLLASLLVGANPAPAPVDKSFDPMRLPRVQALDPSLDEGSSGICAWLQYFMENPERRYRSDGNPMVVTVPSHMLDRVDQSKLGDKQLRTY